MKLEEYIHSLENNLKSGMIFDDRVSKIVKELEQKYSANNLRDYANITHKLSKMLIYEEKGTVKNSCIETKSLKLVSRKERLEGHIELRRKEFEKEKMRQSNLQDKENGQIEFFKKLGLKIEQKDDGILKVIFQDFYDYGDIVFDVLFDSEGKNLQVFDSIPPNILDKEVITSFIRKAPQGSLALIPILHEELRKHFGKED